MRLSNRWRRCAGLSAAALLAALTGCATEKPQEAQPKPEAVQVTFATPEDAVKALKLAVESPDPAAMHGLFGPEIRELMTGDKVQDANDRKRFAAALERGCQLAKEGEDKFILEVGPNGWPMPVPLVRANGVWFFDTPAGKEEIINRHIGKDELNAIGVCRDYVIAQEQYVLDAGEGIRYAQKFRSSPGKKDGLYWPVAKEEPPSPFGALVAEAHAEGYGGRPQGKPHPFHGYFFRILTRQGKDAPGGEMDYMSDGDLMGGFALVAYPERWDQSGIMTFIVNQEGKVYQCNLGPKTFQIAGEMKEYNPGSGWTLVQDIGVANAASEK
jgi:hypothetical protein